MKAFLIRGLELDLEDQEEKIEKALWKAFEIALERESFEDYIAEKLSPSKRIKDNKRIKEEGGEHIGEEVNIR